MLPGRQHYISSGGGTAVSRQGQAGCAWRPPARAAALASWARLASPAVAGAAARAVARRLYSDTHAVALWRDLTAPFEAPRAGIGFDLRPAAGHGLPGLLDPAASDLPAEERWERARRARLFAAGIGTCYVATTAEGEPCYVQWLFDHRDNDAVRRYFAGAYPAPAEGEVLLEAAYTPARFRGRGLMAAGMARIAGLGAARGARWAVTVVDVGNAASLKGSVRAGFHPRARCVQEWRPVRGPAPRPPPPGP